MQLRLGYKVCANERNESLLSKLPSAALTYAKSLQTSAEHQTCLNVMPSAALTWVQR